MHCNLRPTDASALITTPCQVWSRWTYQLPYYSCRIHYFTLWAWPMTLWPWPLTFDREHLQCIACDVIKLCTKFERSYCDFSVWPYDLEHCVTCCARLRYNFRQVWPSTTYPCLNFSVFDAHRYITLLPWHLTSWPWTFTALRMSCV